MRNKIILVVDDDADIRLGYQVLFTAHHYDAFFAWDVLSTFTEISAHRPDLIILDLGLPPASRVEHRVPFPEPSGGFLVMEKLAGDTDLSLIPVVVASSLDPQANRARAIHAGAMAFVQKPWDQDELLEIINQLLGRPELPHLSI
jgi:CheY-like chemotaxis protein